jgi:hypothetical protein
MYDGSGTKPGLPPPQREEVEAWAAPLGWAGTLGWVGNPDSAGTLDSGLEGWTAPHTGYQGTFLGPVIVLIWVLTTFISDKRLIPISHNIIYNHTLSHVDIK